MSTAGRPQALPIRVGRGRPEGRPPAADGTRTAARNRRSSCILSPDGDRCADIDVGTRPGEKRAP